MASNILELFFDPKNSLIFDSWYRKYEVLFLKNGAKLDDTTTVLLLLAGNILMTNQFCRGLENRHKT